MIEVWKSHVNMKDNLDKLGNKACVERRYDKAIEGSLKVYDRLTSTAARLIFVTSKGGS